MAKKSGNRQVIDWLLERNQPAVRYRALVDLLGQSPKESSVEKTRADIPRKGWARDILRKQKPGGYWEKRDSLYRPKYTATNWMSIVLSDLGLTKDDDPRIKRAAALFFKDWMNEGKENIFRDEVCIVGNAARMLTRFGYADDRRVTRLFDRLLEDQKEDGGWHCFEGHDEGTLDCWEGLAALAVLPNSKRSRRINNSIQRGAEFYLERKLFREGKNRYQPWFRFHYPNHYYYDLLVGLDVITRLGYGSDRRLKPALEILRKKRRRDGKWFLDKVHPDPPSYAWGKGNLRWKIKPFALEKAGEPSKWITLTALNVMSRAES